MWSGIGGAHGGFGFGKRNVEDEMILKFADAIEPGSFEQVVQKKERRLFTYESSKYRTVVDYIKLVQKWERKIIRGVTVVKVECIKQHRLLICVFSLQERVGQ